MPNPITGQPWPWEPQTTTPATAAAPVDTTTRDAQLKDLKAKHGELVGTPSAMTVPIPASQIKNKDDPTTRATGYDLYTFADGTSIELKPTGESQNYKESTQANAAATAANRQPTTIEEQKGLGSVAIGSTTYVPDPNNPTGPWIPDQKSTASTAASLDESKARTTQALTASGASEATIAKTMQAIDQANQSFPLTQAESAARTKQILSSAGLSDVNASKAAQDMEFARQNQPLTQAETVQRTNQLIASSGLDDANAAAVRQKISLDASNNPLNQAEIQSRIDSAKASTQATLSKLNQPTVMQTGSGPNYTYYDPAQGKMVTAPNAAYAPTDPGKMTVQLKQQADAAQKSIQDQVAQGKLSPDQAGTQFQQWWTDNIDPVKGDIASAQAKIQGALDYQRAQTQSLGDTSAYNFGQLAETGSNNAQRNVISMMPYAVNASAATNPGVSANGKIDIGQVMQNATFSMPNLQEIGRQGAAAALANISPTAQAHLSAGGPPPAQGQQMPGMPDINSLLNSGAYHFLPPPPGGGGAPGGGGVPPQQTNVQPNPAAAAITGPNSSGFNPQGSTAALNQQGYPDTPEGRAAAAAANPALMNSPTAGGPQAVPPGMYNPWWQQQYPSGVGQPAQDPMVAGFPGIWGQYVPGFGG